MFATLCDTISKRKRGSSRSSRGSHQKRGRRASRDSDRLATELTRVFSSMSLRPDELADQKCQKFKKNLGKLLRAHDHNWKRVPMFFFVDEWISDDGKTISKNRLKQAEKARRQFGIAN